jgi:hypothetical protein
MELAYAKKLAYWMQFDTTEAARAHYNSYAVLTMQLS